MKIRKKFLSLTRVTCPHGCEKYFENHLPMGYEKDSYGNYFLKIGNSKTIFTCHLDTASSKFNNVTHVIENNIIKTDGTTILGADDKAGMVVLLNMIENKIPGLYYFFLGEEVGCLGSKAAAFSDFSGYDRCISFDRRGYNSVITHQMLERCCSEKFAQDLSSQLSVYGLKFKPDDSGMITDSASFMSKISECTNISVGYFKEHTTSEYQDIQFLSNLCKATLKVKWDDLPVSRDFSESDYNYGSLYGSYGPMEDYHPIGTSLTTDEKSPFISPSQDVSLSVPIEMIIDDKTYLVKISKERIIKERSMIYGWMFRADSFPGFIGVDWDGKTCHILYKNGSRENIGNRQDLTCFIYDLSSVPIDDLTILRELS